MVVFLALCLCALLGDKEPPQIWSSLGNCPVLAKTTRRDCIMQLLRRHVRRGMPLSEVAHLLDNPSWLKDECVDHVTVIDGIVPVHFTARDSLYDIRIFPELQSDGGYVYLTIANTDSWYDATDMARVLQGRSKNERLKKQLVGDFWTWWMPYSPIDD